MRKLVLFVCALTALIAAAAAWSAEPTGGTLSVERGRGVVMIDLKGSVVGRITAGSLRVTDQTPNDRYAAVVFTLAAPVPSSGDSNW